MLSLLVLLKLIDFITQNILGKYRSLSSSLCNFLHSSVTSSLLGSNILLNTLFSNTFSLHSFLNANKHVSHPYNTNNNIMVLSIIIFHLWIANFKTKDSALSDSKHSLISSDGIDKIFLSVFSAISAHEDTMSGQFALQQNFFILTEAKRYW